MRITINEPDGRTSGLVLGDTYGYNYDNEFKYLDLDGVSGSDSVAMLGRALKAAWPDGLAEEDKQAAEKSIQILRTLLEMAEKNPDGTWRLAS
ncbi:MAG: hypothetical protein KGZ93_02500 [Actinobacteria bacterium]|nr:hypothetical protein [Actinomycetota bacterium]